MHLIEIFLPLRDNHGKRFEQSVFDCVRENLLVEFDGVTMFTRSPATGLWKSDGRTEVDDIVVFEVLASTLDAGWWADFRENQQVVFKQQQILIRATEVKIL